MVTSPTTSARPIFFKHCDNAIEKTTQKFKSFLFHVKYYESCLDERKSRNTVRETNLKGKLEAELISPSSIHSACCALVFACWFLLVVF